MLFPMTGPFLSPNLDTLLPTECEALIGSIFSNGLSDWSISVSLESYSCLSKRIRRRLLVKLHQYMLIKQLLTSHVQI